MSRRTQMTVTRILSVCMVLVTLLGMMTVGVHAIVTGPEEVTREFNIKADATAESVKEEIDALLSEEYPDTESVWPSDLSFEDDIVVHYTAEDETVTRVTIQTTKIPSTGVKLATEAFDTITATNSKNESADTLLAYINSDLTVETTGSIEYDEALGEAEPTPARKFGWPDSDNWYAGKGGTYHFTQSYTYQGETFVLNRTIKVKEVTASSPSVSIDYRDNTVDTTSGMQWSFSRGSGWAICSDNMPIPSTWHDRTIYFRYAETLHTEESGVDSLYIPPQVSPPTVYPELTSTTNSITITNLWDYDDVEFSINPNSGWKTSKLDSYTFTGLTANRNYTVYVRNRGVSGTFLPSIPVNRQISTKRPIETEVVVSYANSANESTVTAGAVIAPSRSGNSLSGSLSTSQLQRFVNVVSTYYDRYKSVDAYLNLTHLKEKDDTTTLTNTSFTLPMSSLSDPLKKADVTVNYNGELGSVTINDAALSYFKSKSSYGTLNISVQNLTSVQNSSKWKWLYDLYRAGDADIYKLSVSVGSNAASSGIEWSIPTSLQTNETSDNLNVYQVDSTGNGKEIAFTYDKTTRSVVFSASVNGYYAITHNNRSTTVLPFTDVPKNQWYYPYVQFAYERGIFAGVSATQFDPTGYVTRAQIAALLSRIDDFDTKQGTGTSYSDVKTSDWFAPYAKWAYSKGIFEGSKFLGDSTMTREEIASVIYRYIQKAGYKTTFNESTVATYSDMSDINSGNRTAILFLREIGVMSGVTNNMFAPKSYVDRAQMSTIMYNLYQVLDATTKTINKI